MGNSLQPVCWKCGSKAHLEPNCPRQYLPTSEKFQSWTADHEINYNGTDGEALAGFVGWYDPHVNRSGINNVSIYIYRTLVIYSVTETFKLIYSFNSLYMLYECALCELQVVCCR